ncbi:lysine-specific demethylase 4C isoform X2 [Sigmodon hispidus]
MEVVEIESPLNPSCKIMTFRPSVEELQEFNKYLAYMESKGPHRAGLAKESPGNSSISKKPKTEEDEEFVESNGEVISNPAICPRHLKVTEKLEKTSKLGNTEAPSEEASDQHLLNDTKLSGKCCISSSVTDEIQYESDRTDAVTFLSVSKEACDFIPFSGSQVTEKVRFINVPEIDVCIFCRYRVKKISGACIQCSYGHCPASFHVACAHSAGVLMKPDDWPYVVNITCFRHRVNSNAKSKTSEKAISVGQTVITKHRNTRYYNCRVIDVTFQTFYEVMFDDGSFTRDTFPEDIVSRNGVKLGPPAEGEVIQVKWPDGKLYRAKYCGSNFAYMYQVEFGEDGSQTAMKREDIYTLDEELPKRVKSLFSTASDMRFEDTFYGADVIKEERKR